MTGLRFYQSGRTGEEPKRTWAQQANQGVWQKSRRERIRFWVYRNQAPLVCIGLAGLVIIVHIATS